MDIALLESHLEISKVIFLDEQNIDICSTINFESSVELKELTINWEHSSNCNDDYASDAELERVEPLNLGILTDSSLLNVFSKLPKLEYISLQRHTLF